jgi:phosphatidylserine/phosphatidylglycerophosphate/cardiolipin synthase-like enzyme
MIERRYPDRLQPLLCQFPTVMALGSRQGGKTIFLRSVVLVTAVVLACFAMINPDTVHPAEVHFTPDGGIRRYVLGAIQGARQGIDVAVYQITSTELARALVAAKDRGVRVRILTDQEKAKTGGPAIRIFRAAGLSVRTLGVLEQSLMHNKFAVFDDRVVATGSYNWTQTAERANYENLVFLDDPKVVARFAEEFQRLWRLSSE